jgi:hypothetical protein
MSFVAVGVIGGMAVMGAVGGGMKSGPDLKRYGRDESQKAYEAYRNLVSKGPGAQDITAATDASRGYAEQLNRTASSGLYDQAAGNRLAEQQFAGQRQQLAQSLQDQMAVANRAASSAGRSSNDPILRARLGAEAMRQTAGMNAAQASAAQDLGRQNTLDTLNLSGQRVNALQGLADQAFAGQQNLFGMGQNLFSMDMGEASYEASRGGGAKGAITGLVSGAGAGLQMMTGLGGLGIGPGAGKPPAPGGGPAPAGGYSGGGMPMMSAPQMSQPNYMQYFNPANFAQSYGPPTSAMSYPGIGRTFAPMSQPSVFGPNSMSWK